MAAKKVHPLIKVVIVLVVLAGAGWLFVRSAQDARSEPYHVSSRHLPGWTLGIDTAADSQGSVVSLRPPPELPMNMFRQLFSRQMESMGTPSMPGIPLALRQELPATITPEQVLALAQSAGLDRGSDYAELRRATGACRRWARPGSCTTCCSTSRGSRRSAQPWRSRPVPAFKPDALSPVLMMAAQPDFTGWMPIGADAGRDCIAPVTVE